MKTIIYQCLPDAIPPQNCIILKYSVATNQFALALLILLAMVGVFSICYVIWFIKEIAL